MGGNALKETLKNEENEIIRCEEKTLSLIFMKVEITLKDFFNKEEIHDVKIAMPRYIYDKKDFGDLDIVVGEKSFDKNLLYEHLENTLKTPEISENGDITSFAFPLKEKTFFQVDLIFTTREDFEPMLNYLGDNDLSNLSGRLARFIGLKFSMKGLEVPLEYKNQKIYDKNLILTTDIKEILSILDLNHKKYIEGFNNLNELFEYVSKSKYFHKNLYLLENGNHTDRKKDGVRPNYLAFLNFLEQKNFKQEYGDFNQDEYVKTMLIKFNKEEEYNKIFEEIRNVELFKTYFNGKVIEKLFSISGKDLGNFMMEIKKDKVLYENIEKNILKIANNVENEEDRQILINSYMKKEISKYKSNIKEKEI